MRAIPEARGFTLIEVVIALGILGIVVLAAVKNASDGIAGTAAMRDRILASIVAENRAIEDAIGLTPPVLGLTEGVAEMAGRTWAWTRRTSSTSDPGVYRVDFDVRLSVDAESLASLTILQSAPND